MSDRAAERATKKPASGNAFGKHLRVRKRREFLAARRSSETRQSRHFVIVMVRRTEAEPARIGITVSRKIGNAVARNRVKRRVREFFRLRQGLFRSGTDYVFIAKSGASGLSAADLDQEIRSVLRI